MEEGVRRGGSTKSSNSTSVRVRLKSVFWSGLAIPVIFVAAGVVHGQSRGVYPLGMSAINSGITPEPGFTYANQLLFYSRDQVKSNDGSTLPIAGSNSVLMDPDSFMWVSRKTVLGGAPHAACETPPAT